MKRLHAFSLLTVALLASSCSQNGRAFKEPTTLSEGRPVRAVSMPLSVDGTFPDEAFREEPPARAPAKARELPTPTEVRLSNGIRVVLLERHDFPSVSAVLVLERGAGAAAPGVAMVYANALLGDSSEYEAKDAWEYLRYVGGSVDPEASRDSITLQITALSPLFVSALSRAAPMFTGPVFDTKVVDETHARYGAAKGRAVDSPAKIASDALYASIFPAPHPYGVPLLGQRAGERTGHLVTDDVTKTMLRSFRDTQLSAENVGVACVGDFNPARIQSALEKALGKLPKRGTAASTPVPVLAPKSGRKVLVIDRPGAAQSSVAIGWPGPRAVEGDLVALEVLSGAAAGDLSTRLNITVRKELGASYGVHMGAVGMRDGGIVVIATAIETTRTVEALRGLFAQLERLRTEPLTPTELGAAKQNAYHGFGGGTTQGIAGSLAHAIALDLPPAQLVTHNARVDVVTEDSVMNAAKRWLSLDEQHVVIVGDASKIVPGLRALGIGDVTVGGG